MTALQRRTAKVFALLVLGYGLLCAPALFWPGWLDTPVGIVVAAPFLSVYLMSALGIPGLLQHGGACGWGWCAPSWLGWVAIVLVWSAVAWLCARAIAAAMGDRGTADSGHRDAAGADDSRLP